MTKEKRATWRKMFYHQRAVIESVSDEDAGIGLKAAFRYFDGEDIDAADLTPVESRQDYEAAVARGKHGADTRWSKK